MTQYGNRNRGGGYNPSRREDQQRSTSHKADLQTSIAANSAVEYVQLGKSSEFITAAESMAKALQKVDTNQLRNFYESVVEVQLRLRDEPNHSMLIIAARTLPTKVAWAAAKLEGDIDGNDKNDKTLRKRAMQQFYVDIKKVTAALFDGLGEERLDAERYDRFKSFIEAVVVYHKAVREKII